MEIEQAYSFGGGGIIVFTDMIIERKKSFVKKLFSVRKSFSSKAKKESINQRFAIEFHKTLTDDLRREWDNLWQTSPSSGVFNSSGWFVAAHRVFRYKKVVIITVRDRNTNDLLAIVPLIKDRFVGISVFTLPGLEFIDRFSLLVDSQNTSVIREFALAALNLYRVYLPGLIKSEAQSLCSIDNNIVFFETDENPYINFSKQPYETTKQKSRSLKKAERVFGSVDFSHVSREHGDALQNVYRIDGESSKSSKGKGMFHKKELRNFFLELSKELGDSLFVELLFFADEPVAYNIGFECNGIIYCSQKAHLEKHDRFRPGGLMFKKFIEEMMRRECCEIDMGRGHDHFKRDYTKTVRMLHGVVLSRNVVFRMQLLFMYRLRQKGYNLVSKHPRVYTFYKHIAKSIWFTMKFFNERDDAPKKVPGLHSGEKA